MKIKSIEPFVPSGSNFQGSRQLFQELGFRISWDAGDYIGFESDGCKFILQRFDNKEFAENFMMNVRVDDVEALRTTVIEKQLPERLGIRIGDPVMQPYGKEVTLIDLAGVCWHFVE